MSDGDYQKSELNSQQMHPISNLLLFSPFEV